MKRVVLLEHGGCDYSLKGKRNSTKSKKHFVLYRHRKKSSLSGLESYAEFAYLRFNSAESVYKTNDFRRKPFK